MPKNVYTVRIDISITERDGPMVPLRIIEERQIEIRGIRDAAELLIKIDEVVKASEYR
jgi:hypothetical protein